MKESRFPLLLGAAWEVVRFLALFTAMLGLDPNGERGVVPWLLVFGSGQLALAAAFLFLFLDPAGNRALRPFLVLGKALGLFSALLRALLAPPSPLSAPVWPLSLPLPPAALLGIVSLFDLALLGFLLAGRGPARAAPGRPAPPASGGADAAELPEFRETRVEDPPR